MATTTHADPHQMPQDTAPVDAAAELQGLEDNSKKLWHGFTRFLLSNIIMCAAGLIVLGLLTVWR